MADSHKRPFGLRPDEIRSIATGYGSCIASDMITREGRRVGFMYRETPDSETDSGWRFMSGYESEAYMDDADNLAIYDVNTIANYDTEIVPFLGAGVGAAFEREDGTGAFREVQDFAPGEE